jgi:hypothetical protein
MELCCNSTLSVTQRLSLNLATCLPQQASQPVVTMSKIVIITAVLLGFVALG